MKKRVCVYIDGYNLYHSLDDYNPYNKKKQSDLYEAYDKKQNNGFKWLNLKKLMQNFCRADEIIKKIYYFSAYASWKPERKKIHKKYVKILKNAGVTIVLGKFKEKDRYCKSCHQTSKTHEEKQTDVNIVLYLLRDAYKDVFDEAILVSQDSDLCPVVKIVKQEFPDKIIRIVAPLNAPHSKEMGKIVTKSNLDVIKKKHIVTSLFDKEVMLENGKIITRPAKYDPPA